MKNPLKLILSFSLLFGVLSCGGPSSEQKAVIDAQAQIEKDLKMYRYVWDEFFKGDTAIVNEKYFTEDVVIVTPEGNLVGIEAVKNFYLNYFLGFSDVQFTIVDAFGQGDKIVKYWNFKGTHTADFFGIPPSGNKLDLSGTTLVSIKDGKIAREQDFFDMMSMLNQLQQNSGDVTIDAQNQGVL
ncbi:MAG: ester cyclase [Cytophagales bacterium]|nr:ester cyclase [Cytophagales bacterium]